MRCPLCGKATQEGRYCTVCNGDMAWAQENQIEIPALNRAQRRANGHNGIINIPGGDNGAPGESVEDFLAGTAMPMWLQERIIADRAEIGKL